MTRAGRMIARRVAALLAAPALLLAACGDDTEILTMATGSTGGTYFPLGGAIAGVWNDHIPDVRVSTQSSGASDENLALLHDEEVELIMAVNGRAAVAREGTGAFEGEDHDITFIGNVYQEVNQIVARADAGIETVEDLDGMRVALGPPGSGTEAFARDLLDRAGIEVEEFQDTFGEAADRLRDGSIDAAFAILALPAGSLEEVATAVDLNLVSLEGELLEQTLSDDPTLTEIEYEPGTYSNITEPATLVTNWATLYARSDLDEDLAYELTRVLYEESSEIAEAQATGNQIDIESAVLGRGDIPLHPGAERYYEENNALDGEG
ncbi:TAXI family TRAP transporter solute-binding subunit [Actinobacteria bacterium YIM 96077]|uniref:Immunogenic protein n=1 Tax=Phytoactinopolyspora halophila TaxID=1981511 RepID=A0A329QW59_9ACTN|nr:TAXI family TRAP transporter solute-binding subunit [Phytoactinopolyspora halophila]AYY12816.1 TAXI family TRAP transporter solute-binding subunit [Actinobacteria bacterium YIM 96077]RAW16391.1 immunogenic protein [Phytoactinopolyspora halophila]